MVTEVSSIPLIVIKLGNVKTEKMAYISGILIILNPFKGYCIIYETCYGLQCNIQKYLKTKMRDL